MIDIKREIIFFFLLVLIGINQVSGQSYHNFDVKTKHLKKSAKHAEREKDYFSAIDFYEKYLIRKPSDYKSNYALATLYRITRDYHKALQQYEKAYRLEEDKNILSLYYKGRMQMTQERYHEAIETFSLFRKKYRNKKDGFNYRKYAKKSVEGCELALLDTIDNRKIYTRHIDRGINMAYNETSPIPFGDNEIIFASLRSDTIIHYEDSLFKDTSSFRSAFYLGKKEDGKWVFNKKLDGPFEYNDVDVSNGSFSLDSNIFYFTKCRKNWKYEIVCDIYYSEKIETSWSEPIMLNKNINNKKFSSTHPCLGLNPKNGNEILYFSSNNPAGKGGFDLWYSEKKKGEFGEARNLGSRINTEADEVTPFFDIETSTLYFSSDGHTTYGELDIFKSFGNKSKWMTNPENLKKPFNSPADDLYFIYGNKPEEGFLTSNREGGIALKNPTCCDDIYLFVYDEFRRYMYQSIILSDDRDTKIISGDVQVF